MNPETMISAIAAEATRRGLTVEDLCGSDRLDTSTATWTAWVRAVEHGVPLPAFRRRSLRGLERTWYELCGGAR